MTSERNNYVTVLLAALVLTSCGSETSDSSDSATAADDSSTPSPAESEPTGPLPSGTVATKPVPCTEFATPAGFQPAASMPPVMCAFESSEARITVTVAAAPTSFDQLQRYEDAVAESENVTPPALEQVTVEGWTFAALWPELDGFNRMDKYLVDTAGNTLACKVGVQGATVDASTHADFCEDVRARLYTP